MPMENQGHLSGKNPDITTAGTGEPSSAYVVPMVNYLHF